MLRYDIDGVKFGDDWGQQNGLIFGGRLWRRFIKPRLARMYGMVKRAGKAVMIHSCGRVQELFPDLIELGLDVFNPFQPEVMDPYEMKRQFGRELDVSRRNERAETPSVRHAAGDSRRRRAG